MSCFCTTEDEEYFAMEVEYRSFCFGYLLEVLLRHSPSLHGLKSWGLTVKSKVCFFVWEVA